MLITEASCCARGGFSLSTLRRTVSAMLAMRCGNVRQALLLHGRIALPRNAPLHFRDGRPVLQKQRQIIFKRRRRNIALVQIARQRLVQNRGHRIRTAFRQRARRTARLDQRFQFARILRLIRRHARHHFVQRHAHRPEIRVPVHLPAAQSFRRAIAGAAQSQMRAAMRKRQRLRDAEIQQPDFVVRSRSECWTA